ncbi:alpha/beta hydrolase fold protein [Dyadobacter fermentans DSM 18053]|uniref:Alpha/beta hydrolase fold protein n=1 Tax=Dyadobacter fermentans (strain ATCC 700827 / DSM 18053 / CIP 107007 / KCTC 52180 / NS114) TaxID=471854 RepID=C6W4R6_DYAFD|nr:alpha/beta hydrolase fold protein [Dyadobacter fermentans DSM 18053]
MPLVHYSHQISPFWLPNGHFQSIYPALFRQINGIKYFREKIVTPDDDFLNLDWSYAGNEVPKPLIILSHGLEGNSTRQYITGMVKLLTQNGFDCLAWNFRSCGGEMNQTARFYHSGATEDLNAVINYAFEKGYADVRLVGFSLGGNLTLKYLGEQGAAIDNRIKGAIVFSVPMDLKACSLAIIEPRNQIYMHRFLKSLKPKVMEKAALYPQRIDLKDHALVKTLYDFDHIYTAPLHGFEGADHYYAECSSQFFVEPITVPTMIVNAENDPIVPFGSLPIDVLRAHPNVTLLATRDGGHCGFRPARLTDEFYWSEKYALGFLSGL